MTRRDERRERGRKGIERPPPPLVADAVAPATPPTDPVADVWPLVDVARTALEAGEDVRVAAAAVAAANLDDMAALSLE